MRQLDFFKRSFEPEWLDMQGERPDLSAYLADLAWFNGLMLGPWAVVRWLKRAVRHHPGRQLTLLDAGCGDGSLLRTIAAWADREAIAIDLIGIDIDPDTIGIARARTGGAGRIAFAAADIFNFAPEKNIDIVVSSLLAHHLDDEGIVALLRWMEKTAGVGWLVYDLQRSAVPFHAIGALGRLTKLHPLVVQDGRISVRRSLTRAEWHGRIRDAGLSADTVRIDCFLFRLLVSRTS